MSDLNEAYEKMIEPKEFVKNFKTDEDFIDWLRKGTLEEVQHVQEAFKGSGLRKHPKLIKKFLEENTNDGSGWIPKTIKEIEVVDEVVIEGQVDLEDSIEEVTKEQSNGIGLGDIVEKVTEATRVKSAVEKISKSLGVDCGCDERKKKWNKIRIFQKLNPECLTEEEVTILTDYFKTATSKITVSQQKTLLPIYNRVFRRKQEMTSCAPCWRNIVNNLKSVLSYH